MTIPTFIDIEEQGQCKELREYFNTLKPDFSAESSPRGYLHDLEDIIGVCEVCFEKEKEPEVESVLNSIVSLLIIAVPQANESCPRLIDSLCKKLSASPKRLATVSIRVLQNLMEGLGKNINLQYGIYLSLITIAGAAGQISLVFSDITKLKSTFSVTTVGVERAQRLLRELHRVLVENRQSELAANVMIELLSTYSEETASQAHEDAERCIVSSIADPNTFLMDHLLTLKPVKYLEGSKIHDLLTIFVTGKLAAYNDFYNSNKQFVDQLGLNHDQSLNKMRLLTFMQLAEGKKEIPFDAVISELQIEPRQVECFVLQVLKTRLVRAKVDQVGKRVIVSSTMHRTFGRPQWQALRETLVKWRDDLNTVQSTVQGAIRMQEQLQIAQ